MKQSKKLYIIISVVVSLSIVLGSVGIVVYRKNKTQKANAGATTVENEISLETAETSLEAGEDITAVEETSATTNATGTTSTTNKPNSTTSSDSQTTKAETTTTPQPVVAPVPVGSHAIAGQVPQKAAVSGSYFDDAVFIGDSVSLKLNYYEASANRLGNAQFLTAGSLSSTNALWEVSNKSVHPKYNGKKQKIEDSVAMCGAKKVYIMLGMNDINAVGIDGAVKNFEKLCDNILAKSPNVVFYVQSMTPLASSSNVASSRAGRLNNTSIFEYNKKLAGLCQRRGWYFINVAEVMYNEQGYLKNEYCGDLSSMGLHFTNEGCRVWVDYLLTHTP